MGCRVSLFKKRPDMVCCLQRLDEVEALLQKMCEKYTRQEESLDKSFRVSRNKMQRLHILRRKKVTQHYVNACHARMNNIYSKRMALEQLNLNQTQLEAMRAASNAFSKFSKNNSIEKIEELQSNMESMFDDVMEIDTILSEPLLQFDDSELLKEMSSFEEVAQVAPTSPRRYLSLDDEREPLIVSLKLQETPVAVQ